MKEFRDYLEEARSWITESQNEPDDNYKSFMKAIEDGLLKKAKTIWRESSSQWMGLIGNKDLKKVENLDSTFAKIIKKAKEDSGAGKQVKSREYYDSFMFAVNSALNPPPRNPNIEIVGPKKTKEDYLKTARFYWDQHKDKFVPILKKQPKDLEAIKALSPELAKEIEEFLSNS